MKKIFILLFLFSVTWTTFATEQETDLLIVGNDTIHFHNFPLEDLKLIISPFGNTYETAPSTSCWRGYRAIWRLIGDKLHLEKIIRCTSDREKGEENIINLLTKNGIEFQENDGLIFAEWVTTDFYRIKLPNSGIYKDKIHLLDDCHGKRKDRNNQLKLIVERGEIKLNKL